MSAVLQFACVAACITAAAAVEQIHLTNVRITFADGRSALSSAEKGSRGLRDSDVSPNETAVHVHFIVNETGFDLDLQLLPSIFTDNAASMRDFEPSAYSDESAVFTLGIDGVVSGTIWEKDGIINVHRDVGDGAFFAEKQAWDEESDMLCGIQTEDSKPASSTRTDRSTHNDSSTAGSPDRHRRAYDQWWRTPNPGSCYTNDDVATAANMGIAVGYNAWVKWGETEQGVAEALTTIVQNTNRIYRAQFNMAIKVDETHISKSNGQEDMDATKGSYFDVNKNLAPIGCSKGPYEQLIDFAKWKRNDQALWHFFDDCLPAEGGTNGIAMLRGLCHHSAGSNSALTYLSTSTWPTFAHEVGHTLGAKHPFETFQGAKGSFGGLMDYSNHYALQSDGTTMKSFNTESVGEQICDHLESQLTSTSCDGHITADAAVCGDGVVKTGFETCECADGSKSCTFCSNCQLAVGKGCTREAVDHKGDCFCSADGKVTNCNGICGPNGSCQTNHDCGLLDELWIPRWIAGSLSVSCGPDKQNNCKVVCSDGRSNPMNCNANFDGFSSVTYTNGLSSTRPVTFMPDGTKCLDTNNLWSTCASNDDNTEITCKEIKCGNGHVDVGEECDCASVGSTSCAFCNNCKLDNGKECSRDSAGRSGCDCGANGMLAACDGICGPAGICQRSHDCGNLEGWLWQGKLEAEVCNINSANNCKVVCADGRDNPATCNSYFDKHLVNNRPVTFMPDGTKCLDSTNVWSTCESKMAWRCGNNGCKDVFTDIWCKETAAVPDIICQRNMHVLANACVTCPAGTNNAHGDNASGPDTSCEDTICAQNERVAAKRCTACPAGSINLKGDNAFGPDTACDDSKFMQMNRGSCEHRTKGTSYVHIESADDCRVAAAVVSVWYPKLNTKKNANWQRGCFKMNGKLYWNEHGSGKETNSPNRKSFCKEIGATVARSPDLPTTPSATMSTSICAGRPIKILNKGSCEHKSRGGSYSHIETAADCIEAATKLDVPFTKLVTKHFKKWQIGCLLMKGQLYWNRHATGKENKKGSNRRSLCCVNGN